MRAATVRRFTTMDVGFVAVVAVTGSLAKATTMVGELMDIYGGGRVAWQLSPDGTGPREARGLVRTALNAMTLPAGLIDDAVTMVSELATNAHLHGRHPASHGAEIAPELWLYLVRHPELRLVCKVFDANRQWLPPNTNLGPLDETGRGIRIVETLSDAWGVHLTRARLAPWRPPGKAVWFTCALPASLTDLAPPAPRLSAAQAAESLQTRLADRGITAQCHFGGHDLALMSVQYGLTVWVHHTFSWQNPGGGYAHHALTDIEDTADHVLAIHEKLGAQQPEP